MGLWKYCKLRWHRSARYKLQLYIKKFVGHFLFIWIQQVNVKIPTDTQIFKNSSSILSLNTWMLEPGAPYMHLITSNAHKEGLVRCQQHAALNSKLNVNYERNMEHKHTGSDDDDNDLPENDHGTEMYSSEVSVGWITAAGIPSQDHKILSSIAYSINDEPSQTFWVFSGFWVIQMIILLINFFALWSDGVVISKLDDSLINFISILFWIRVDQNGNILWSITLGFQKWGKTDLLLHLEMFLVKSLTCDRLMTCPGRTLPLVWWQLPPHQDPELD